jgi:hypothetical protein
VAVAANEARRTMRSAPANHPRGLGRRHRARKGSWRTLRPPGHQYRELGPAPGHLHPLIQPTGPDRPSLCSRAQLRRDRARARDVFVRRQRSALALCSFGSGEKLGDD